MGYYSNLGVESIHPKDLLGPLNDVEIKYSPDVIYVKGDKKLVTDFPRASIIGTRNPTETGIINAKKVTEFLVKKGVVIVSGLARGIDTITHKTTIDNGGKTIGVLGTSITRYYPKENRELQDEIAKNHLLISQFDPNSVTLPRNFPERNRTMALFSDISIIIEAGKTSGTQHQGWEALRLGRQLFIMENIANDTSLGWPQKLLEYGALKLSISNLEILLDYIPNPMLVIGNGFD